MKKEIAVSNGLRQLPIRPICLVTSEYEAKRSIITVGMFAYFSGNPTLVGVGIAPSRYSFGLIRKSGEFVVNIADENLSNAVRICGENSGADVDKFELAHLTPKKGVKVNAPLIEESPLSIECKVVKEVETGDHVWFIGEVFATSVREGYDWKDGLLFKWVGERGFYHKVGKEICKYQLAISQDRRPKADMPVVGKDAVAVEKGGALVMVLKITKMPILQETMNRFSLERR